MGILTNEVIGIMAKKLDESEIKLLQRAINDTNMQLGGDIVKKARAILDYCEDSNRKEVCAKYNTTSRTVQRWIEKFQLAGSEGRSEQKILLTLSDKPFKRRCHISEEEMNLIIPDFSKNPIEYGLCYSVWDKFTVGQFLNKYYPRINASPATIKRIIQACQMKYKDNFFDQNYNKIDAYKKLLDDQSAVYLYCYVYYLGSKEDRKKRKLKCIYLFQPKYDKQYFYGTFV